MILMNDFTRVSEDLRERERRACARVLASGWSILGKEVEAFETEWARTTGVRHVVGVANGLDALEISIRALGLGAGDEIITTPMTAFATVLAILRAGAIPVLADIEPGTANIDLESAERCRSQRTRAILPVHLYGRALPLDRWSSWCREHGLHLIEDCAQAHLAGWQDRSVGSWGAISGWSFYPTKNLGACGDAGAIATNDDALAELCRRLRNYGQSERYYHPELGMNSRLDELQAALLSERLRELPKWTMRRCEIASAYRCGIDNPRVGLLDNASAGTHVYHLFVITCTERDRLAEYLRARGVQTLIHYPVPVHRQKPTSALRRDPKGLSICERHAATCLSLPCSPHLSDDEVATIVASVNAFR